MAKKTPNCMEQAVAFNLAKHLILSHVVGLDTVIDGCTWFDDALCRVPNDWTSAIASFSPPRKLRGTSSAVEYLDATGQRSGQPFDPMHPDMFINADLLIHGLLFCKNALPLWGEFSASQSQKDTFKPVHSWYCDLSSKHRNINKLSGIQRCVSDAWESSYIEEQREYNVQDYLKLKFKIVCDTLLTNSGFSVDSVPPCMEKINYLPGILQHGWVTTATAASLSQQRPSTTPTPPISTPTQQNSGSTSTASDSSLQQTPPLDTVEMDDAELNAGANSIISRGWSKSAWYRANGTADSQERFNLLKSMCPNAHTRFRALGMSARLEADIQHHADHGADKCRRTESPPSATLSTSFTTPAAPDNTGESACQVYSLPGSSAAPAPASTGKRSRSLYPSLENTQQREGALDLWVVRMIELVIARKRFIITPATVEAGLLCYLGNMSKTTHDCLSKLRMIAARSTCEGIVKGLVLNEKDAAAAEVKRWRDTKGLVPLTNFDNYVTHDYRKRKTLDESFVKSVYSMTMLGAGIPVDLSGVVFGGENSKFYEKLTLDRINIMSRGTGENWFNTAAIAPYHDKGHGYQSLSRFTVLPCIDGKSSSHSDVKEKVMIGHLMNKCDLENQAQFVVMDTEIIMTAHLMMYKEYQSKNSFGNVIILPCPFHDRMHLLRNIYFEPVFLLLVFLPYRHDVLGMQKAKCRLLVERIMAVMSGFIKNQQEWIATGVKAAQAVRDNEQNPDKLILRIPRSATATATTAASSSAPSFKAKDMGKGETLTPEQGRMARLLKVRAGVRCHADFTGAGIELLDGDSDDDDDDDNTRTGSVSNDQLFDDKQWEAVTWQSLLFRALGGSHINIGHAHKDLQQAVTNYARSLFQVQLLDEGISHFLKDASLVAAKDEALKDSKFPEALNLVHDAIINGVQGLIMSPFQDIIRKGRPHQFIQKMMMMTNFMAFSGREKVVRAKLAVSHSMLLMNKYPKLIQGYVEFCTWLNDNFIELQNSKVAGCRKRHPKKDEKVEDLSTAGYRSVVRAGILATFSHQFAEDMSNPGDEEQETPPHPPAQASASSSATISEPYVYKHEGEVIREENMARTKKNQKYIPRIADWYLKHLQRLASVPAPPHLIPKRHYVVDDDGNNIENTYCKEGFSSSNSIAAMCTHGGRRIANQFGPNYMAYLDKKEEEEDYGECDFILKSLLAPDLKEFLKSKEDPYLQLQPKRNQMCKHIVQFYSFKELSDWLLTITDLCT